MMQREAASQQKANSTKVVKAKLQQLSQACGGTVIKSVSRLKAQITSVNLIYLRKRKKCSWKMWLSYSVGSQYATKREYWRIHVLFFSFVSSLQHHLHCWMKSDLVLYSQRLPVSFMLENAPLKWVVRCRSERMLCYFPLQWQQRMDVFEPPTHFLATHQTRMTSLHILHSGDALTSTLAAFQCTLWADTQPPNAVMCCVKAYSQWK